MQHEQQHTPSATAEQSEIQLSARERRTWFNEPRTVSATDKESADAVNWRTERNNI